MRTEVNDRPLLLIDVDGVLNPHVAGGVTGPDRFAAHQIGGMRVHLSTGHGDWLRQLTALYELVWVTTWEEAANALIGPVIGAPAGLPWIEFNDRDDLDWIWKLPAVERYAGNRPVAWLDDDPGQGADEWAADRAAPTLLVKPQRELGWVEAEYDRLVAFAEGLTRQNPPTART